MPPPHGWNIDPLTSSYFVKKSWRTLRIIRYKKPKYLGYNDMVKKTISRYCPFKSYSTILTCLLCQVEYREVVQRVAEGAVLVATPSKDAKEVREPMYSTMYNIVHPVGVKQISVRDLWHFGAGLDPNPGSVPLTKGSGSGWLRILIFWSVTFKMPTKFIFFKFFGVLHRKKRFTSFPSPAGMSLTKLPLGRNNSVMTSLFTPRESLVVTSRLGTGNSRTFFLRCRYRTFWRYIYIILQR